MFSNGSNAQRFAIAIVAMACLLCAGCQKNNNRSRPRPAVHRHAAATPERIVMPEPAWVVEDESRVTGCFPEHAEFMPQVAVSTRYYTGTAAELDEFCNQLGLVTERPVELTPDQVVILASGKFATAAGTRRLDLFQGPRIFCYDRQLVSIAVGRDDPPEATGLMIRSTLVGANAAAVRFTAYNVWSPTSGQRACSTLCASCDGDETMPVGSAVARRILREGEPPMLVVVYFSGIFQPGIDTEEFPRFLDDRV